MDITFEELRRIKHALPAGSIARIAHELNLDEHTVRSYFGANNYTGNHAFELNIKPGPGGGIVHLEDVTILKRAIQIIEEHSSKGKMTEKKKSILRHMNKILNQDHELLRKLAE